MQRRFQAGAYKPERSGRDVTSPGPRDFSRCKLHAGVDSFETNEGRNTVLVMISYPAMQ